MKKIIGGGIIVLTVALLVPQIIQAQGTMTYLSNLGQTSTGSDAVGSNSWLAAWFETGSNANGYVLNSIQLGMADASGNPSDFTVMLYTDIGSVGPLPGSSLGNLSGSTDPATGNIYTYADDSSITLLPHTTYFIVVTAGTTIANGAYEWNVTDTFSYNPSDGWEGNFFLHSSNGSSWNTIPGIYAQYALNATPIPESDFLSLFGLGGLFFLWHRRKAKAA
jgi:hypothetical protein